MAARFEALGFPPNSRMEGLVYSQPARAVVAHFYLQTDGRARRLHWRPIDALTYTELVPHSTDQDLADPVACPRSPWLYYNRSLRSSSGSNWDGLFRVDLSTRIVECLLDRTHWAGRRVWVSRILGISADGSMLFVVRAEGEAVGTDSTTYRYRLSEFDIGSRTFTDLTTLEAIFA